MAPATLDSCGVRVAVRMRSRAGLHDSDLGAVAHDGNPTRIVLTEPGRVVGVLVDGAVPGRAARARAPDGDWFELEREPPAELGGVRPARKTLLASELELATPGARQIEIHVDYEVHALRDFARAHRLDFQALAYGRESFDQFHGYRIVGALPGRRPPIEALAISRPAGRFGNNLMQLAQATHVARALGVTTIYVPPMPWFEAGPLSTRRGGLAYVDYSDIGDIPVPSLFATFLFEDLEPAVATLDGELRQRLVDRHVSSLFRPPPAGEPRPPSHIAVHIRSGDLFDRSDPHPNFVQPPLAFYALALSHFAETRSDIEVTLVYEDDGNPVIPALRASLESSRTRYSVSSASLFDDLAQLLEHRALVLGRGSFGVAVAALSTSVETIYVPWSEARFPGLIRERQPGRVSDRRARASVHRRRRVDELEGAAPTHARVPSRQPVDHGAPIAMGPRGAPSRLLLNQGRLYGQGIAVPLITL